MTGLPDTPIALQIPQVNQTLPERGIPEHSWYEIEFQDGSIVTEKNTNWSLISEKKTVAYFGNQKVVHLCKFPVKRIEAFHDGLHSAIDVPEGCEAYQAVRGETLIVPNLHRIDKVIGRIIGVVKGGEVIQEHFLNGHSYNVEGLKK